MSRLETDPPPVSLPPCSASKLLTRSEGVKVRIAPRFKRLGRSAALASWLGAASVSAQQSVPAPANPPPSPPQTSVTVVAPAPGYRSTIDRRSYSLTGDLQKDTGSLADVLSHVPAVQVDIDGNVSLRGDSNVTILVDGKPSALFSGPGRAQALQSMSADQFNRVEVMTNPPAGVTAEGSGGVINLISRAAPKRGAAPSASGSVKADVGSGGRFDLGASGTYSAQGLSLSGGASFRRSALSRDIRSDYGIPGATTSALVPAEGLVTQRESEDTLTANGAVGYDLGPHDHFDAGVETEAGRLYRGQNARYQTTAPAGPLALDYDAPGFSHGHFTSTSVSLGLTHTLPGDGESVSVKLLLSQGQYNVENGATYAYTAPAGSNLYQNLLFSEAYPELDLKVDYTRPLPGKAKLTLGYEGRFDWGSDGFQGTEGSSAALAVTNPVFAHSFTVFQEVDAVYAAYEQAFGKLTVQPGLRLESAIVDTDLVSAAETGRQAYLEADPSLHLDYRLDDASEIKASYGRRTQRPGGSQLDPFRIQINPTFYVAGNVDLRPAITQSYELGYEYRRKTIDLQATLFYRDKTDLLTQVTQDIGGDVLVKTWENIGREHDVGLELVANRDLFRTLSINASADLLRAEADAANLGFTGTRSAFVVSGRVTVNWQVTPNDFLQLSGQASGRQLTAQGYTGGSLSSNFGWRHQFDSRLAALLTANNPFGLSRRITVIDTPTLVDVEKRKSNAVAVFLGLTYAFGAAPKRPDSFDFAAQGQGGP